MSIFVPYIRRFCRIWELPLPVVFSSKEQTVLDKLNHNKHL